jgi:hypothetical protein
MSGAMLLPGLQLIVLVARPHGGGGFRPSHGEWRLGRISLIVYTPVRATSDRVMQNDGIRRIGTIRYSGGRRRWQDF